MNNEGVVGYFPYVSVVPLMNKKLNIEYLI